MPIVIDKKVMHGKPVIKGTRIPVDLVVGSLAGGMTYKEVCQEYGIKERDILDCLKYVAELTDLKRFGRNWKKTKEEISKSNKVFCLLPVSCNLFP